MSDPDLGPHARLGPMNERAPARSDDEPTTSGHDIDAASSADYLLRSLQSNQLSLSAIADQKASILVGATMVVLGVVAPIDADDNTSAALIILAVTAGLAGAAAVAALIPRVRTRSPRRNVLFFGVHSTLSSEEFHRAMGRILSDAASIHEAIVEDVHQMGLVLSTKFRFINLAYAILLVGLSATTIAYLIGSIV